MSTAATRRAPTRRPVQGRRSNARPNRRPSKKRFLLRRVMALSVLVAAVLVGIGFILSPLFTVDSVEVTGTSRLSAEQIRKAAAIDGDASMLGVDTDSVADRVAALAPVSSVEVSRSWPSTVDIAVVERRVAAWTRGGDGSVVLVDADGTPFASAAAAPKGVLQLRFSVDRPDPKASAALAVYRGLSPEIKKLTTAIDARSPAEVELALTKGRMVRWGDEADSDRKNRILVALLSRPGRIYDVGTPSMPTVTP